MSAEGDSTKVTTSGGRHGAVAGTIHGGVHNNYYQVPDDASPAQKFEVAMRYLESGQATTARRLLGEVTVDLRDKTRVWFFWLLAFFSGRTLWELSHEDRAALKAALERVGQLERDRWSRGIDVIRSLVNASSSRAEDASAGALQELDRLEPDMQRHVLRHLERVLQGSLKDAVWHRDMEQATADQTAGGRADRVWKFFEPDPAAPRTRPVRPATVSVGHAVAAAVTTIVAATSAGVLGWLVLLRGDTAALIAIMTGLAATGVTVVNGAEMRFRTERRRAGERELRLLRLTAGADRPHGFAGRVDRLYVRYLIRYAPDGPDRASWLIDAYVAMCRLRDELVEVYREQRVKADAIEWLVRFQVRDLRRQWADGLLADRRRAWSIPARVRAGTIAGVIGAGVAAAWAAQSAARQDVLLSLGAMVVVVVAGFVAVQFGVQIVAENKRATADEADRQTRMTAYWLEYQRWKHRLDNRPSDIEMANWLDCDRRMLLQRAIRAYQLRWGDVSAYASLEARGENSRKARAKNGPWRYSRYRLLVFLLTADGVRQITVDLDFAAASFHNWQRTNYRYDAVAAARVTVHDDGTRQFQLFLVNGANIEVGVTEAGQAGEDEDSSILADGAQDATGLRTTLFVLEGVAAEGRSWWAGPAYRRAS